MGKKGGRIRRSLRNKKKGKDRRWKDEVRMCFFEVENHTKNTFKTNLLGFFITMAFLFEIKTSVF